MPKQSTIVRATSNESVPVDPDLAPRDTMYSEAAGRHN